MFETPLTYGSGKTECFSLSDLNGFFTTNRHNVDLSLKLELGVLEGPLRGPLDLTTESKCHRFLWNQLNLHVNWIS